MAFIVAEGAVRGRDATGLIVPFCELEKATPPSGPNLAGLLASERALSFWRQQF